MLNQVGPDGSYHHINMFGLCNWVYETMPPDSHPYGRGTSLDEVIPGTANMYEVLAYFDPTNSDIIQLSNEGKNIGYWGSDNHYDRMGVLTDLRATILCFCAAINNEL